MSVTITVNNDTDYLSLSYYCDADHQWHSIPFGVPTNLQGTNPPGLIALGITGGPPQQMNIGDTSPPQPPFTDGAWALTKPGVAFIKDNVVIRYSSNYGG